MSRSSRDSSAQFQLDLTTSRSNGSTGAVTGIDSDFWLAARIEVVGSAIEYSVEVFSFGWKVQLRSWHKHKTTKKKKKEIDLPVFFFAEYPTHFSLRFDIKMKNRRKGGLIFYGGPKLREKNRLDSVDGATPPRERELDRSLSLSTAQCQVSPLARFPLNLVFRENFSLGLTQRRRQERECWTRSQFPSIQPVALSSLDVHT